MSLIQTAVIGVRWTTFSMGVVSIIQMVKLVVLAHILVPDMFGLLAMMVVVTTFAELLSQLGLNEAIIQRTNPTQEELSSLFWLKILSGSFLYGIVFLFTPTIAAFYSEPELKKLLPYLSLLIFISPWGTHFKTLLQKQLSFKPLAIIEIVSAITGFLVSIIMALEEFGVWALVYGQLISSFIMSVLLVIVGKSAGIWPKLYFNYSDIIKYLPFGLRLVGSNVINYFNFRVDQLVVGSVLGAQALGYYSMAFNLVLQPMYKINPVLTQVTFPVLVRVKSDKMRLQRGYFKMLAILSTINTPILVGVAAIAPVLIPFALGNQWSSVVSLIQVLALYSLMRAASNASGSLLLVCGLTNLALIWNLIQFAFIPVVIFFSAKVGGLNGVAWGLFGLQLVLLYAWYYFTVKRLFGECFIRYIRSIIIPVLFSIPMALAIIGLSLFISSLPNSVQLLMQLFLGVAIYFGLYWIFKKEFLKEQFQLFLGRLK